jgi:hypothetical protein
MILAVYSSCGQIESMVPRAKQGLECSYVLSESSHWFTVVVSSPGPPHTV